MKALAFLLMLPILALPSCTKSLDRAPSSVGGVISIPNNLEVASKELLDFFQGKDFNAQNCGPILGEIYDGVFNKNADYFDRTALGASALPILNNFWLAKIALRNRFKEFAADPALSKDCVRSVRAILRAIRFAEDYIGAEKFSGMQIAKSKRKAFTGGFPYLMINPTENDLDLRSGDVLLSRGTAFTSAAIARIGDDDSQFSHLAILYVDEATGEKYVVEAHIEIGTKVSSLETYASDGKARALVFRQPDKELGKVAAKKIYDLATKATNSGKNIPYDFGMNLRNHDEIFCSEIVEYGYELAARELGREFKIPKFPTTFSMKNRTFLEGIGVKSKETFAPADIEVDPRFKLISEWRDFDRIRLTHYHDAVLTAMFAWMEDYNYVLKTDPITFVAKNVLWQARRWPLFSELLKERFPENMSKDALGTMMLLDDVAGELYSVVEEADKDYRERTGLAMTAKQLRDALDDFRKRDFEVYKYYETHPRQSEEESPEAPKIHWKFAPKD